ncbi:MAG TPA: amidohydrolase family protein [Acidimicrobiales bacterium]|nr:amidohydrolase family protein [Acidimicrobiales bacterium]
MTGETLVIDADGHVEEDLQRLVAAVPDGLRDVAADLVRPTDEHGMRTIEGRPWGPKYPFPFGENNHLAAGGVRQEGGRDPRVRIEVLDNEGIDAAVLYPSSGQLFFLFERADVAAALCRAYNDWLAEYCSFAPDRLIGVALLPQHDPELAAAELERAVGAYGFVGGVVRPNKINGRTVDDPAFDVLWATAQRLDVPVGFHEAYIPGIDTVGIDRMSSYAGCHVASHVFEQMTAMLVTTLAGIQDRFPGLRLGFLEAGCGWAPTWLDRIEEHYELSPADYRGGDPRGKVNRRTWLTFEIEEPGLEAACELGWAGNIMFASDYPHFDAVYPGAVKDVRDRRRGLAPDVLAGLLGGNALGFYGPRLERLVAPLRGRQ